MLKTCRPSSTIPPTCCQCCSNCGDIRLFRSKELTANNATKKQGAFAGKKSAGILRICREMRWVGDVGSKDLKHLYRSHGRLSWPQNPGPWVGSVELYFVYIYLYNLSKFLECCTIFRDFESIHHTATFVCRMTSPRKTVQATPRGFNQATRDKKVTNGISCWWFFTNPCWKICDRQIGFIFPRDRGENSKIFELPPPSIIRWGWWKYLQNKI